jgi:NAD(P)H-hydrate epimerase
MKLISAARMRDLERRVIQERGISGQELMDRAGRGVAEVVRHLADSSGTVNPSALLFAGRGNNGGDAFATARHLQEMGFDTIVWIAGTESEIHGDALKHLSLAKSEGIEIEEYPTREDWENNLAYPYIADFLVDGLLGTGSTGPARGPVVGAIRYINAIGNDAFVVSIDLPSGIHADTGIAEGDAVNADVTATLGLPKIGLVAPAALEFVGGIEVIDIGLPSDLVEALPPESELELIYSTELKKLLPRRLRSSHKGTYGHALLVGGARGYAGAIALAARAALRSGVGRVTVLTPEGIVPVVAGAALEAMVFGVAETTIGSIAADAWEPWASRMGEFDALLTGPGLTRHPDTMRWIRRLLAEVEIPLVLDADALNVLSGESELLAEARSSIVITPHPGEMARLLETDTTTVQADRLAAARRATEATRATVVLKGAGTLVAALDRPVRINMTGNPGMASGGAGDVLAGLLTGLLAQGLTPFDAACAAVFVHGRAGDMAAWRGSQTGLTAGDIIGEIPYAFRELTWR